jgi:hypothetical protein
MSYWLVLAYPDKPWDWSWLGSNPNITFDVVMAYFDKPWNWYGLSSNPNMLLGTWHITRKTKIYLRMDCGQYY